MRRLRRRPWRRLAVTSNKQRTVQMMEQYMLWAGVTGLVILVVVDRVRIAGLKRVLAIATEKVHELDGEVVRARRALRLAGIAPQGETPEEKRRRLAGEMAATLVRGRDGRFVRAD